jgi:pimeloyl-ACP methyl ester carboxylesterase
MVIWSLITLSANSFSPTADPLNVVQALATLSAIVALTNMLRAGSIPEVPKKFSKVIHVGHSFGSALSYALAATQTSLYDGIVLTAWAYN